MEQQVHDGRQPIAMLAPDLVERIAAGEVIERPASVVRELIENALDAGATSIRIELRDGGARFIQVSDDGLGIREHELALALAPHATSKVRQHADLEAITTFGFRGEALASMAAVAEVELCSAADSSGIGHVLALAPGRAARSESVGRQRGTTVTVRDLFQHMPARQAMLRGPLRERTLALNVVRAYALAHAAVRFVALADGKIALQTHGGSERDALSAVFGLDVANALVQLGPVACGAGRMSGWVASRAVTYADRRYVVLCVNGRPVQHRLLVPALEAGYRPLLHKGRHPVLLALITLDPRHVDVNIHAAKAEVFVRDERQLAAMLRECVYTALGKAPQVPRPPLLYNGRFSRTQQYALPLRRRRSWHIAENRPRVAGLGIGGELPASLPPLTPLGQIGSTLIIAQTPAGDLCLIDQHRAHERLLYETLRQSAPRSAHSVGTLDTDPLSEPSANSGAGGDEPGRADEMLATHQTQLLLEPLIVQLTPRQAELLSTRLHELRELGLVCEPFGGATFLVRALPALPGAAVGLAAVASAVAADAAEDADDWLEQFCIALACRTALRRGTPLELADQRALLNDLRAATVPLVCPHGSPIVAYYAQSFLAHLFEW